ncbi:MAG: hypothetical protein ACOYKZ_04120 [Chlamydiia bacterium]
MSDYPYRNPPKNGQPALDNSVYIPDDTRRLGVADGAIVVFYPNDNGCLHGIEIAWNDMDQHWQHMLQRAGMADQNGLLQTREDQQPIARPNVVMASQNIEFQLDDELAWQILLYEYDPHVVRRFDWSTIWLNTASGDCFCVEDAEELEYTLSQIERILTYALSGQLELHTPLPCHFSLLWALYFSNGTLPACTYYSDYASIDRFFAMHRFFSRPNANPDTWIYTRDGAIHIEVVKGYACSVEDPLPESQDAPNLECPLISHQPLAHYAISHDAAKRWLNQIAQLRARCAPYPGEVTDQPEVLADEQSSP